MPTITRVALVVLAASATVQAFAILAALRLVAITRQRLAWGLVAAGAGVMLLRRGVLLWDTLTGAEPVHLTSEVLGLLVSVLLVTGLLVVTQRARASMAREALLASTADRYRNLFERHPAIMLLVDPKTWLIVDVNPAAESFYGHARETLQGAPLGRLLRDDAAADAASLAAAWLSGRVQEDVHRLAGGELREVEVRAGVIDAQRGRTLCAIVHDVAGRKAAERDRREQAAFPEHNPAPTLRVDPAGAVLLANPAAQRSGIHVGHPLWETIPVFRDLDLQTAIEQGHTHVLEAPLGDRTLHVTVRGLAERGVAHVYTSDITDLKHAQDALRASNEELRRWIAELERHRHDSDAHIELGALLQSCESVEEAGHVIERLVPTLFPESSGAAFLDLPLTTALQCIGRWGEDAPLSLTFHRDTCWAVRRGQMHAVENVATGLTCPHLMDGYDGYSVCLPLRAQGAMPGVLTLRGNGRLRDATGQRQARMLADTVGLAIVNLRLRESLREQSIRDALTGLFNRRYLEETLSREVARAVREQAHLSLLMIDLDHFKRVNDTYGHAAGDRVLQAVADLLQRHVRSADIVCRYGGEEFAVLMPDTSIEHALARAEDLRRGARALELPGPAANEGLSLSVGVATFPSHGRRAADLVRASDAGLYAAKNNGRDRVELPPAAEQPVMHS